MPAAAVRRTGHFADQAAGAQPNRRAADSDGMNLLGGQMVAPAAEVDRDLEQVLLGLADGSYVLSTPDGAVAESGIGVVGLLGVSADALVGRPIAEVLVAGADAQTSSEFEQMLRAPSSDPAT